MARDYKGVPIAIGDTVRNIESGWRGVVQKLVIRTGEPTMLVCKGVNWWTNTIDEDDTQHHGASDVIRLKHHGYKLGEPPATTNFL